MPQKRALVTGASEGIGREFALQLAKAGFLVTAVARNEVRLKELVLEMGEGCGYMLADLSSGEGIGATAAELRAQHYDLLINNAGHGIRGKFYEIPLQKHLRMLDLNVTALVSLAHVFLNQAQSGDALINVSSGLAFLPMPSNGSYSASKALVTSLSESLWYEQKARGIYVMGLCPGITDTKFSVNAGGGPLTAPKVMIQTSAQVVSKALRELKARRKPTVMSGFISSIFVFMSRLQTRKAIAKQMGAIRN